MKKIIIIFTLFLLVSCSSSLPEGIKIENITRFDYQGKTITFGDDKNNSILIPFELLEQKYIPDTISVIHIGHQLTEEEILKVFQYNLNFIEKPEINFGNNALTEKVHDIFVNLDIKEFSGSLLINGNCSEPIIIPKESSDKYLNSKIEKFDIYATCWNDVMKRIHCSFEGHDRKNEKIICG